MIFVTVGTHEQPFDRLVKEMDRLKDERVIEEDVVIQTGFGTYEPRHCKWNKWIPYQDMVKYVSEARIVITHGGPASFMMPLQYEKIPVVVPRQKQFGEHVNDHQVEFVRTVAKRNRIIPIYDIGELGDVLQEYETYVASKGHSFKSNNERFNDLFNHNVQEMFRG